MMIPIQDVIIQNMYVTGHGPLPACTSSSKVDGSVFWRKTWALDPNRDLVSEKVISNFLKMYEKPTAWT